MKNLTDISDQSKILFVKTKAKSRPFNTDYNQQVMFLNGLTKQVSSFN